MTPLPDWLVERAALDEAPPRVGIARSRGSARARRPDRRAARGLRRRAGAPPAGPAVAQLEVRRPRPGAAPSASAASAGLARARDQPAAVLVVARLGAERTVPDEPSVAAAAKRGHAREGRAAARGVRQAGEQIERLEQDTVVHAGDVIQLRYTPAAGYGVIASLDGAGVVTLHFPLRETRRGGDRGAPETATLPHAYALDDAPRFERFFFITANDPVDVQQTLAALRALRDATTAPPRRSSSPRGCTSGRCACASPTPPPPTRRREDRHDFPSPALLACCAARPTGERRPAPPATGDHAAAPVRARHRQQQRRQRARAAALRGARRRDHRRRVPPARRRGPARPLAAQRAGLARRRPRVRHPVGPGPRRAQARSPGRAAGLLLRPRRRVGILVSGEHYDYARLRQRIRDVPATSTSRSSTAAPRAASPG